MARKVNKVTLTSLKGLQDRICTIYQRFVDNDVELHFGNGTVSEQLSCAIAALECILQEY